MAIRLWTDHLGIDGLAVIVVLLALQSWLMLLDLGVGPVLQIRLSAGRAAGINRASSLVGAIHFLSKVGIVGAVLWCLISVALINLMPSNWVRTAGLTWSWVVLAAAGVLWAFMPVSQLILRVWFAEEQGWRAFLVPASAQALGCLAIFMSPSGLDGASVLINAVVWILPQVALPAIFLWWRWRALTSLPPDPLTDLWRDSRGFALFALLAAATIQVDILTIAYLAPTTILVEYSVIQRTLGAAMSLVVAVIAVAIPAMAAGLANRDRPLLYRRICGCLGLGFCIMGSAIFLLSVFGAHLGSILVPGTGIVFGHTLIVILGIYWLLRVWTDTWAGFHQATGNSRSLLIGVIAQGPITWALMAILGSLWGAAGIALAMVIGFGVTAAWWLPWSAHNYLTRISLKT